MEKNTIELYYTYPTKDGGIFCDKPIVLAIESSRSNFCTITYKYRDNITFKPNFYLLPLNGTEMFLSNKELFNNCPVFSIEATISDRLVQSEKRIKKVLENYDFNGLKFADYVDGAKIITQDLWAEKDPFESHFKEEPIRHKSRVDEIQLLDYLLDRYKMSIDVVFSGGGVFKHRIDRYRKWTNLYLDYYVKQVDYDYEMFDDDGSIL